LEHSAKYKDFKEAISFLNGFCTQAKAEPLKVLQETNIGQLETCKASVQKFANRIEAWEIFDDQLEIPNRDLQVQTNRQDNAVETESGNGFE